jgi:epoxide hydrolase
MLAGVRKRLLSIFSARILDSSVERGIPRFRNTAASSARIYWENKGSSFSGGKLTLPVAATVFPRDIYRAPKSWPEQTYSNLIYWNEAEHGGHFAAFEQPDIFVEEMRSAF